MQESEKEMIFNAMMKCYDTKDTACTECPLSEMCSSIDADRLGEIFAEAAGFILSETEDGNCEI